jgi:hypothetical protein
MDKNRLIIWLIVTCEALIAALLCSCGGEARPIPTGTVDQALESRDAFYSLRGGSDYDRLPLRFPLQVIRAAKEPDLCNGKVIIVKNVTALNVSSNLIFGTCGGYIAPTGELREGGWFVVDVENPARAPALDRNRFERMLSASGVTNLTLRPVGPLIEEFMFKGTLPFGK